MKGISLKSILLVTVGLVCGVVLTFLIMHFVIAPTEENTRTAIAISDSTGKNYSSDETDNVEFEEDTPFAMFTRDISGDCSFIGIVLTEERLPIANAEVGIWLNDQSWSQPQPPVTVQSDKNGRFSLDKINGNIPLSLWASAQGYRAASIESPTCGTVEELVLSAGGEASFKFTENGQAVSKVYLKLFGAGLWPPRLGVAGEDGNITISGLDEGDYWFLAEKKNGVFVSDLPIEIKSGETTHNNISLVKAQEVLVRVLDAETKQPVAKAFASVDMGSSSIVKDVLRANEKGEIKILCPAMSCSVTAYAQGYQDSETLDLNNRKEETIGLNRGGSISGKVIDKKGMPVQGAAVTISETVGASAVPLMDSETGNFHRGLLYALSEGLPPLISSQNKKDKLIGPPSLFLNENISVGNNQAFTDSSGGFVIKGLPPRRILVSASHPDMIPIGSPVIANLDASDDINNIVVYMKQGARITLRVLDEREVPVLGAAAVVFDDENRLIRNAESDTDGYIGFSGLPFGVRIEISKEDHIARVIRTDLRAAEAEIEVKLETGSKILRGRVKDSKGFGVGNAAITARLTERNRLQVLTGVTYVDGTFMLEGAGEGSYYIAADAGERGSAKVPEATFRDEIKLVLDTSTRMSEPDDKPLIIAPTGWSGASINNIGGEIVNNDHIGADNLGIQTRNSQENKPIVSENSIVQPNEQLSETTSTPFGEAHALEVTGPPPGKGGLPIELSGAPGKVTVSRVAQGSRVEVAGLKRGARILSVNGTKVSGPAEAKRLISGPIGTVVMLEVSDNADGTDSYTIIVQRERL